MDDVPGFLELLADARAGDPQATEKLLAWIRPWLERLAREYADPHRPDGSVSDLVQEAWLRAWQKLDQFHGSDDEAQATALFRAWLARIVSRLAANAARDRQAKQRKPPGPLLRLNGPTSDSTASPEPPASGPTPSAHAQADEQARRVHEALARLADPLDRAIVRLRFFEGVSLRQIGERLGCNHETVRQRYHTLLGRLQQDLGGLR
jgi:RNA polymerase sigma factor (sigma-70 family)